jgi:putative tail protein
MASFLGGGDQSNGPVIANGLDISQSTNVMVVPKGYGTNTLAGNLIFTDDFQFHNNSGGKGFGGKGGSQSFYSANVAIAFGRFKVSSLVVVFEGSQIHFNETGEYLSSIGATLFTGTFPDQSNWMASLPNSSYAALNYPSISGFSAPNFNLGGSPSPPNFNYVISCDPAFFAPYSQVNIYNVGSEIGVIAAVDGDPALIINDIINGPIDQGCGFPGLTLDLTTLLTANAVDPAADNTFQTWCYANFIAFSPFLRDAEKMGQTLDRWASFLFFEIGFWDGSLKILSRGDQQGTNNGVTFVPVTTPVFALTIDDFVTGDKEMPIKINRKAPEDIPNVIRLECTDPNNLWSPVPVEVRNEVDFLGIGSVLRVEPTIEAHDIVDPTTVAPTLANLILKRRQNIRCTYEFSLGPALGSLLTPMDLVSLTDPTSGLVGYVVRITELASDERGVVKVTAEDYLLGSSSTAQFGTQASGAASTNTNVPADSVNAPIVYEPPSTLADPAQLFFVLSGGFGGEVDPNWGGCQIWGSVGGGAYSQLGTTEAGQCAQGLVTANIATYSGANPDTTNTLSVQLNESGRTLSSFPTASAANGSSVCIVDGELIGYTTATLTTVSLAVQEIQFVPASPGPYVVTVTNAATFISDGGVSYTGGAALTEVGGAPAVGQYHVNTSTGAYTFNSADSNKSMTISYTWTAPAYNLTGLYRGLYGTAPAAHTAGAAFGLIGMDPAVTRIDIPAAYVGTTADFKFPSFNIFGTGLQSLASCTVYPYTILGTGFGGGPGVPTVPTGLAATNTPGSLPTVDLIASEALAAGAVVNIWDNSGTANARNANATDGTKPAFGFVLAAVSMGGTATVSLPGALLIPGIGLTAGAGYFLSTTGGDVTATPPVGAGNLVQPIGVANGTGTAILFAPAQGVLL